MPENLTLLIRECRQRL